MSNTATLTVDLSALAANYQLLRNRLNDRLCAAVVKANAYGLGVEAVSKKLWQESCRGFFVATLAEAVEVRGILPDASIYIFQGVLPGDEKYISQYKLIPVLNNLEQVARWGKTGGSAALHIDTGMTRLGLTESEALDLAKDPERIKRCGIKCIISHLACANDGLHPKNDEQLARFKKIFAAFPQPMVASIANSAGIFLGADYHYDMARPGCALYGINPIPAENPMRHVASLSAPILQIRHLDRDETVGYGATFTAKKGSRIAICGLGYADGFLRAMSNKGYAYVVGLKVPIIGRVSMDMVALDINTVPESKLSAGTRAEFINGEQTVNHIAQLCGTIGYEIFTRIGARVQRVYG